MNILISGGAGYIGTKAAAYLKQKGHHVRILDNLMYGYNPLSKNFETVIGDVRNPQTCSDVLRDVDAVLHLAGLTLEQCDQVGKALAYEIMVDGTKNLFEKSRAAGATRFLFASTCSVYGQQANVVHESSVPNATTFYAELKLLAEEFLRYRYMPSPAGKEKRPTNFSGKEPYPDQMRTTIMRFATAYGPSERMRWNTIPNKFIADVWSGKPIELYGPQQHRPIIHTEDIARAIGLLLESEREIGVEAINVGSNQQNYEKLKLATEITAEIGGDIKILDTPDVRDYQVSFDKLEGLGFKPEYTPKQASRTLYDSLTNGKIQLRDDKIVITK